MGPIVRALGGHDVDAELAKNVCLRCKKPIADKTELLILNKEKFHAFHFNCASCSKPLDSECKELDSKLYCPPCYNKGAAAAPARRSSSRKSSRFWHRAPRRILTSLPAAMVATCASCRRPIEGRAVTALGKQYHPEVLASACASVRAAVR